jgi:hypothetical protein
LQRLINPLKAQDSSPPRSAQGVQIVENIRKLQPRPAAIALYYCDPAQIGAAWANLLTRAKQITPDRCRPATRAAHVGTEQRSNSQTARTANNARSMRAAFISTQDQRDPAQIGAAGDLHTSAFLPLF